MEYQRNTEKIGLSAIDGCLLVSMGGNLDSEAINQLGKQILHQVVESHVKGAILNVSAISIMDSHDFLLLRDIARAVSLLGCRTVFVGFQPGIVSYLIDLGLECGDLLTAVTMEDALEIVRPRPKTPDHDVEEDASGDDAVQPARELEEDASHDGAPEQ